MRKNSKKSAWLRQRRTNKQLSSTVKELKDYAAADHLGKKSKHDPDVEKQHAYRNEINAKKLGIDSRDLDDFDGLGEAAQDVGLAADKSEVQKLKSNDDMRKLLGRSGLVLSLGYVGEPDRREWVDLEGDAWTKRMMEEKKNRSHYITGSRNHLTNTKQSLKVMLARLTPWTAIHAVPVLIEDRERLCDCVVKIAADFSKRYNVDVIGVVAHRESPHDLHVHLVFSETRERVIAKKKSRRVLQAEKKQAHEAIRAKLREAGMSATNKTVAGVLAEETAKGQWKHLAEKTRFMVEYHRVQDGEEKVRRNIMGHPFRSKYQIWSAAREDDKAAIAAFRDKAAKNPYSFRALVMQPEEGLLDYWWDLWASERWNAICMEKMPEEVIQCVAASGQGMAAKYLEYGSTNPTKIEVLLKELETEKQGSAALQKKLTATKTEFEIANAAALELNSALDALKKEHEDFVTKARNFGENVLKVLKPIPASIAKYFGEFIKTVNAQLGPGEPKLEFPKKGEAASGEYAPQKDQPVQQGNRNASTDDQDIDQQRK